MSGRHGIKTRLGKLEHLSGRRFTGGVVNLELLSDDDLREFIALSATYEFDANSRTDFSRLSDDQINALLRLMRKLTDQPELTLDQVQAAQDAFVRTVLAEGPMQQMHLRYPQSAGCDCTPCAAETARHHRTTIEVSPAEQVPSR